MTTRAVTFGFFVFFVGAFGLNVMAALGAEGPRLFQAGLAVLGAAVFAGWWESEKR
jgi:hypothetical protein